MTRRQQRALKSFGKIAKTGIPDVLAQVPDIPAQFSRTAARFTAALQRLDALCVQQVSGHAKVARGERRLVCDRLRDELLAPVSTIAKTLARDTPGFATPFRIPHKRSAIAAIVEQARQTAAAAEPHRAAFVHGGMDDDFVEEILKRANELEAMDLSASTLRRRQTGTTQELKRAFQETRDLATLLNAILRRYCAKLHHAPDTPAVVELRQRIPGTLRMWESCYHVEREPVRRARRLQPAL